MKTFNFKNEISKEEALTYLSFGLVHEFSVKFSTHESTFSVLDYYDYEGFAKDLKGYLDADMITDITILE